MKIAIVVEYYPASVKAPLTGGVESRCFAITQRLAKNHDVTVICSWQKGQQREAYVGKVKVLRVGMHHAYSNAGSLVSRFAFAYAAWRKLLQEQYDIVEGDNFISYLPAYFAAGKAKRIAIIHEVWQGEWIKNKGLYTGIFGHFWEWMALHVRWDALISVSEFTAKRLERYYGRDRIHVIPNGIALSDYKQSIARAKQPTILCVSRLTPQKRIVDMIAALPHITAKLPQVRCKIIGTGPEMDALKKQVHDLKLDNVEFIGFVEKHKDVLAHMKKCHLFVHPSILEGFGMVVVEAMACGTPYVVSDIPALHEVTQGGKGGLLCQPEHPDELAAKCIELLSDKKLYVRKMREGKELVARYDWEKIVADIEDVYRKAT